MEVKLPTEEKKPLTEAEIRSQEKQRILLLIIKSGMNMTNDYKGTIKHTGGLLVTSMGYAYSKGIQDVIKLLSKETNNEPVQK